MAVFIVFSYLRSPKPQLVMHIRLNTVLELISHYKYLIVIVVGLLFVGFLDEYSMLHRWKNTVQINQLKEEIEEYNRQDKEATDRLNELQRNPKVIEKIARERYFMKADDEDIFVITHDKALEKQINEKTQ